MDDNHLNRILKNQLEEFEASPPTEAWNHIHQELKRDRKIAFHQRLSTLIVILSLSATIFLLLRPPVFQDNVTAGTSEKIIKTDGGQDIQKTDPSTDLINQIAEKSDQIEKKNSQPLTVKKQQPRQVKEEQKTLAANRTGNPEKSRPGQFTTGAAADALPTDVNTPGEDISYESRTSEGRIMLKKPDLSLLPHHNKKQVTGVLAPVLQKAPFSQEETVIPKRSNRFELFAMAIPSMFYHNLETNKSDDLIVGNLEDRNPVSGERVGYKTAVGGAFRYRQNLEFSLGVIYGWANESFNFTERTISGYHTTPSDAEGLSFTTRPEFIENDRTVTFNRRELGIQLGAALLLFKGRTIEQSVGGNIAVHRNLENNARTDFETEDIGLRNYFSYLSVFYKMDYRLSRRFDLTIQPTFNYASFINENETSPVYIKPNNLSLNFGLTYHL
ncbi:hypothetical protein QQ020_05520 [Fulvivirgaceae bacterium BMA12]|uniref:Outer membrane protein beta-barrel domain-containing protein n=1 Tax=Agaribacillus aureus TaxID=3051825 RepID=A0ABT8L179_9BACT|nr:hypothetical protein [Fulvivirgaceae bacterium BMA12]